MLRSSKKRSTLTVQKYRDLNSKRSKVTIFSEISNENQIVSQNHSDEYAYSSSQLNINSTSESSIYYVLPPLKGIDLVTIRNNCLHAHSSKSNIVSIMSRAI